MSDKSCHQPTRILRHFGASQPSTYLWLYPSRPIFWENMNTIEYRKTAERHTFSATNFVESRTSIPRITTSNNSSQKKMWWFRLKSLQFRQPGFQHERWEKREKRAAWRLCSFRILSSRLPKMINTAMGEPPPAINSKLGMVKLSSSFAPRKRDGDLGIFYMALGLLFTTLHIYLYTCVYIYSL